MNKKLITTLSVMILVFGLTGCKQNDGGTIRDTISNDYAEINDEDFKIVQKNRAI